MPVLERFLPYLFTFLTSRQGLLVQSSLLRSALSRFALVCFSPCFLVWSGLVWSDLVCSRLLYSVPCAEITLCGLSAPGLHPHVVDLTLSSLGESGAPAGSTSGSCTRLWGWGHTARAPTGSSSPPAAPPCERRHLSEGGGALPEREEAGRCWREPVLPLCPRRQGDQLPVEGRAVHGRRELL